MLSDATDNGRLTHAGKAAVVAWQVPSKSPLAADN
jgi:hypothetical protein